MTRAHTDTGEPNHAVLSASQQRKRDAIVAAALNVFDRDGFEAARMIDIAKAAGVAKGTLYLYFETKEDLLEGLIEAVVVPAVRDLQGAAQEETDTATQRLHRQLSILSNQISKGEMLSIMKLMVANGPHRERLRLFYFQNVVEPNMVALDRTIREGVETGEFDPSSAETLDNMLLASPFVMAAFWKILFHDVAELDEDALFNSVWVLVSKTLGID